MGQGPQYVIAQLNEDNVPVAVGVNNPLKISGGGGGGGGGGAVDSVNGQTGVVVLEAADVGAATQAYVDSAVSGIVTVPSPPATGTFTLEAVDGVMSWVEVV